MTLFDRYLLQRFLSVFMIMFVSTFGLFMVIDGFTNVDEFQSGGVGAAGAIQRMSRYYLLQSSVFFEMVGPILAVVTVMVVFALLQKNSEVHPILAAGIPTSSSVSRSAVCRRSVSWDSSWPPGNAIWEACTPG